MRQAFAATVVLRARNDRMTQPNLSLSRLLRLGGQPFKLRRGGASQNVHGLPGRDKATGEPYVGFAPEIAVERGDVLEAELTGELSTVIKVSADVLRGRIFMWRAHCAEMGEQMGAPRQPDPHDVFVVYGRDHRARDAVYAFLNALGLRHIEFDSAAKATGAASPSIDRVLDSAFDLAQAVVVLLTGDDEARLGVRFRTPDDPSFEHKLTPQPRLNVIFEAGLAFGRQPNRVILVQVGEVRPFSDIAGLYVLRMKDTAEDRMRFKERLKTAGCAVEDSGLHWLKAGHF